MTDRARRSNSVGARRLLFVVVTLLAATARTARPNAHAPNVPPLAARVDAGAHHVVELEAQRVDLEHTGAHTHANWVVFELPFEATDRSITNVHFRPRALVDTDVGALHFLFTCLPAPTIGPVEGYRWKKFTVNGVAQTDVLSTHPYAPTFEKRAYAINVPTRVANAAACGDAAALLALETWRLEVEWDDR